MEKYESIINTLAEALANQMFLPEILDPWWCHNRCPNQKLCKNDETGDDYFCGDDKEIAKLWLKELFKKELAQA